MRDNHKTHFSSSVTGGSFELYVKTIVENFGNRACLNFVPLRHRFSLPCFDGQGEIISEESLNKMLKENIFYYSKLLLCNYVYLQNEKAIVLFDDNSTLSEKTVCAKKYGLQCL